MRSFKMFLMSAVLGYWTGLSHECIAAPKEILGIAGGSHMVNDDFDFILNMPPGWDNLKNLDLREGNPEPADIWRMTNARVAGSKDASTMKIEFFSSLPVKDLAALRMYVELHYPNYKWSDYVDQTLVGLKSNEMVDPSDSQAKIGHLFYFMDSNMIVATHWRKHPSNGGDRGVSDLILSMDRKTAPPVLRSAFYSTSGPIKPGESICLYLKVDDLKSSFQAASLMSVKLAGFPSGHIWQDVIWDEQTGRFNVCFKLPTSIAKPEDLKISELGIKNERGNALYCDIRPPALALSCGDYLHPRYLIDLVPPVVENSNVDRIPPEMESLDIVQDDNRVIAKINAHDSSGLLGGWLEIMQIPGGIEKVLIAPWQFKSGVAEIDLTRYSTSGTRRISQIAFADKNSIAGTYVDCHFITDSSVACKPGTYAKCTEDNKCTATQIPVVEYFSSKRKPQN